MWDVSHYVGKRGEGVKSIKTLLPLAMDRAPRRLNIDPKEAFTIVEPEDLQGVLGIKSVRSLPTIRGKGLVVLEGRLYLPKYYGSMREILSRVGSFKDLYNMLANCLSDL